MRHNARHNAMTAKLSRQMHAILEWIHMRHGSASGGWVSFSPAEFLGANPARVSRSKQTSILRSVERLEARGSGLVRRRRGSGAGYDGKPIALRLTATGTRVVEESRTPRTRRGRSAVPVYYLASHIDMLLIDIFRYASLKYRGRRPEESEEAWALRDASLFDEIQRRTDRLLRLREDCPEAVDSAQANMLGAITWVYPEMLTSDIFLQDEVRLATGYETLLFSQLAAAGMDPSDFRLPFAQQNRAPEQPLGSKQKRLLADSETPF